MRGPLKELAGTAITRDWRVALVVNDPNSYLTLSGMRVTLRSVVDTREKAPLKVLF